MWERGWWCQWDVMPKYLVVKNELQALPADRNRRARAILCNCKLNCPIASRSTWFWGGGGENTGIQPGATLPASPQRISPIHHCAFSELYCSPSQGRSQSCRMNTFKFLFLELAQRYFGEGRETKHTRVQKNPQFSWPLYSKQHILIWGISSCCYLSLSTKSYQ